MTFPVLADFSNDGRAILANIIETSLWGSLEQAIASFTVFAHPDVIASLGARAVFRTIRGAPKGLIRSGIMLDDNASPATAFQWATGFKPGRDLTCNHLYSASHDPNAYSDVRNICYTPTFIAKLTDSQKVNPPDDHLLYLLKYRAFDLYGYAGPESTRIPFKPILYDKLNWPIPIGKGASAGRIENLFRIKIARRKRDRLAKSARFIGWNFSDYVPDPSVEYIGSDD